MTMARTGAHLKIKELGSNVLGVALEGDPRRPEPDEFRVTFPGGDVSITRCTDGTYWIHMAVERADHPRAHPDGADWRVADARIDVVGKHTNDVDVGGLSDPGLYHVAIRVAPAPSAVRTPAAPPARPVDAPAKRKPWTLIASAPDVAGIQKMIGDFWPASGYTVDPETLALLQHGQPSPRGRVVRLRGRFRFEIPARG